MINRRRRRLSRHGVGVVAESHGTGIGDLLRQEIFQPERLRLEVCPGVDGAAEAVDSHDTKVRPRLAKTDRTIVDRNQRIFRRDLFDGGRYSRIFWRVYNGQRYAEN
jgi:hypothetical protein